MSITSLEDSSSYKQTLRRTFGKASKMALFHKELIKKTAPSHTPNPSKFFSVTTYSRAYRAHTPITSTGTLGRKERKKSSAKLNGIQ